MSDVRNLSVGSTGALTLGNITTTGTANFVVAGAVTQQAGSNLTFGGASSVSVGIDDQITLTQENNSFGGNLALDAKGADVRATGALSLSGTLRTNGLNVTGDDAITLGVLSTGADLAITTTGTISQTGAINVAGMTTLATGLGNDIVLLNAGNELGDLVTFSDVNNVTLRDMTGLTLYGSTANDLTVTAGGAIVLGSITTGGALRLSADGTISQESTTDALNVGSITELTAAGAGTTYDITLANETDAQVPLNEFIGVVSIVNAADVVLSSLGNLTIGVTAAGDADIYAQTLLSLAKTTVLGDLRAQGNFTLAGDISAKTLDLISENTYHMGGYSITAETGDIVIEAIGDIILGQIVAENGNVFVTTQNGTITDGFGKEKRNIVTSGTATLIAGAGSLGIKMWAVGSAANETKDDDVAGTIDVSVAALADVSAPDGVTLSIGVGNQGKFQGVLNTAGDLVLDFGASGIDMATDSALRAGGNVTILSDGDITLAEVSAGRDGVFTLTTKGVVQGRTNTNGTANITGGTIVLNVDADIGTSAQSIALDALTASDLANGDQGQSGTVRLVTTPENAYLDIITAQPDGAADAPTVNLGTALDDWEIGKNLVLTAQEANLILQGNITGQNVSIDAKKGRLTMIDGKTVTSLGTITLAGANGLNLSNIVGSTTDTAQQINVQSGEGNIRDITADELANIVTAGRVNLDGASIGTQGVGDIDLFVGVIDVTTTSENAGGATLQSLVTDGTYLDAATTTGALALTVNSGDLFVTGNAKVGGLILNLGAISVPMNERDIVQTDGTTIESLSAATMIATGDIKLSQLSVLTGDVTLNAQGVILDVNTAINALSGKEVANIVMGSGALTAEALSIGTTAADGDIDLNVANIASLVATDTTAGEHITVASYSNATLTELDTTGKATFVQASGELVLAGTVRVDALDMAVHEGSLSQSDAAKLFVTDDITLTAAGDMALSGITSLEGNVVLNVGGALLDNSVGRETAIITTSAEGKTVRLAAGSIGTTAFAGEIEIATDQLESAITTTGGINIAGLRTISAGTINAANGVGDVSLGANDGKLTLTAQVRANKATVFATTGGIMMDAGSAITTAAGATMTADGDMLVTEITASAMTSQTLLSATGALTDNSADEPTAGWNIDTFGLVELSAATIGTSLDGFDVRTDTLNAITATDGATLLVASKTGTTMLTKATVSDGKFALVTSDNLEVAQSVRADELSVTAGGTITQQEISKITTIGDLSLIAGGDITLGSLQTTDGTITLDASLTGYILDGTVSEATNITGLAPEASLVLTGRGVGIRDIVAGATGADPLVNVGDIDLDIATVSNIMSGDGGIYLGSVRDLRLETVTSTGEMELLIAAGDLTLAGQQSVLRALIEIEAGALNQLDGTTLDATGATGAGRVTVTATNDISVSRITANNGDMSLVTTRGDIIDNSSVNGAGNENLVVTNGKLTELSADAIGNRFENGSLDVATTAVGDITASSGNTFISFTGVTDSLVTIDNVSATARDADVGLISGQGGLSITSLNVARELTVEVAGSADAPAILLGNTTAGGDVTLAATAGNIDQMAGATIIADGKGTLTTLTAGGDITLDAAGNDLASLTVVTGNDVTVVDRDGLDLYDVTVTGTFDLATGDQLIVHEGSQVKAGDDIDITVAKGQLDLQNGTVLDAGGDISLATDSGDLRSLNATQVTAQGAISANITGDITFAKTTIITSGGDTNLLATGNVKATGTTRITSTAGSIYVASTSKGTVSLTGTSVMTAQNDLAILANDGDILLAGATTVTSGTGTAAITASTGKLGVSGTSTIAGDNVEIATQAGVAISGKTSITADVGDIDATVAAGNITLTGTTTLTAQTNTNLAVTGAGDVALSGTSVLTATTGDLAISQTAGNLSFKDSSTLTAKNDIKVALSDGYLKTSSATTLSGGNDIDITLENGIATLIHRSIFEAGNTLGFSASDGISGSGLTDLLGGQLVQVEIANGDGTFINTAKVESGQGDVDVSIDTGNLSLRDDASVIAAKLVSIKIGNGGLSMEDAETLISGTDVTILVVDGLTPGDQGNVRIDRIEALNSTTIQTLGGMILDNTFSELDDNIVSPELTLVASDGIGAAWEDNLNVNTQLLAGQNTATGGINIQNRTEVTIAPEGVRNHAEGDVAIIAFGPITFQASGYSFEDVVEASGIFTVPGQRLILLSNQKQPYFDQNWGNSSRIQVLAATSSSSASDKSNLIGSNLDRVAELFGNAGLYDLNFFDYGTDAFDRFLKRFEFEEDEADDELRPIQIADYLLQNIEDNITLAQQAIAEAQAIAKADAADHEQPEVGNAEAQPVADQETVTLLPLATTLMSPMDEETLVIEGQASEASHATQGLDRPVILQAMLLADDEIDMPLIAAE